MKTEVFLLSVFSVSPVDFFHFYFAVLKTNK